MMPLLIALVVIFVVLFVFVASAVKIVHPYERGIVEMLGKYQQTAEPGLRIIFPFFQTMRLVDMREQVVDVPPQEVITKDNVAVTVDAVVYYEPTDPQRLVYNIANFIMAVTKLAQTNLRNVIGEMSLDEALTSRDTVNTALREILDDATDKWGVRVVRVEIQKIDPPTDVMNAMHEQMKAERTRRAVVTEASGAREAAVTRAEGEKTSAILTAEGRKESLVLDAHGEAEAIRARAEAEQYRKLTVAQGEAAAIDSVYNAIMDAQPTQELLAIKYLESLEKVADGNSTKIFLPAEMGGLLGSLGGVAELFGPDDPADTSTSPRPERQPRHRHVPSAPVDAPPAMRPAPQPIERSAPVQSAPVQTTPVQTTPVATQPVSQPAQQPPSHLTRPAPPRPAPPVPPPPPQHG